MIRIVRWVKYAIHFIAELRIDRSGVWFLDPVSMDLVCRLWRCSDYAGDGFRYLSVYFETSFRSMFELRAMHDEYSQLNQNVPPGISQTLP